MNCLFCKLCFSKEKNNPHINPSALENTPSQESINLPPRVFLKKEKESELIK
jgi:hypothetical protein